MKQAWESQALEAVEKNNTEANGKSESILDTAANPFFEPNTTGNPTNKIAECKVRTPSDVFRPTQAETISTHTKTKIIAAEALIRTISWMLPQWSQSEDLFY